MTRRQPQRIPPPITFGTDRLEGLTLLEEQDGQEAAALWKLSRLLRMVTQLPESDLETSFGTEELWISLTEHLSTELESAVVPATAIGAAHRARLSRAAQQIGEWADRTGRLGTALEFTQSASLLRPTDAGLANATARLARRRGEYARAESWYRQAIWIARQQRDRKTYAKGYLGIGTVHMARGNHPAAKNALIRGLRAAKRSGSRELIASAYHELAVWAMRADKQKEVTSFARAALKEYGPMHPRLPALAHDVALMWMKHGNFAEALKVFVSIAPGYGQPIDQISRAGATARAAGSVNDRELYENAWADALALLRDPATTQAQASCYLYLAHAARAMGERGRAQWALSLAREVASMRGEAKVLHEVEALESSLAESSGQSGLEVADSHPTVSVKKLAVELSTALNVAGVS